VAKELADKLALIPGDKFILRNDRDQSISLIAGGIFDLGTATGSSLVVLSLDRVRAFFDIDGVSALELQVADVFDAESIAQKYSSFFSRVKLESWQKTNREMLAALSSQSSSSYTIQFFVLFSISLGIASVLAIAAVQKSRQLGILKAMGTTDLSSAKIFVIQGFILGTAGSVIGLGIGYGISILFIRAMGDMIAFGLEIKTAYIIVPVVLAVIASTAAAVIPANRASKLSPIEVIRNG
jgi:lipoprotein-releasing system permease protein